MAGRLETNFLEEVEPVASAYLRNERSAVRSTVERMQAHLEPARWRVKRAFYRSRTARRLLTRASSGRARGPRYDLTHLAIYAEHDAVGPLQRDEALFLYALTQVTRPRTIVEFGFLGGRSAFNFLQAMDESAHLYSFDISDESAAIAAKLFGDLPNFTFHHVSQTEFDPHHVGGGPIDLVFVDAAHELELNQRTFARLEPLLAPSAIVAVHDTGTWNREHMVEVNLAHASGLAPADWLSEHELQHQVDERRFVNWVLEQGRFDVIHLHTTAVLRHGLTLLQRRAPLPTAPSTGEGAVGQRRPTGGTPERETAFKRPP